MLSEISHTEKDKYCIISLICEILKQNKIKKKERERERSDSWLPEAECKEGK